MNYGSGALMVNEFKDLELLCPDASIVPSGPGYNSALGLNQVCTLLGTRVGE